MAFVNIQNLIYKYPTSQTPVLQNINLQINKGEFVAVIGANGAGKSSLCYALAGFVPHFFKGEISGDIEVDGIESSKSTLNEWVLNVGPWRPVPARSRPAAGFCSLARPPWAA